ncbi:5-(carboxyamino)imidazole ribonucleotide mutase [Schleiferilactobacillus perolens]|jgi:5-(carboxyamino)imidazole ribonucleotide mutase|uniref:5-(carboxyamino)imidazole ribonucleotide mutase n=1 Tax=Schleiferilactobacillus perolens TaxID=100468 RepID=UPI0039E7C11E
MVKVAVVMGSVSDWPTLKETCAVLRQLEIPYTTQVISAHRMPTEMQKFAQGARAAGYSVIIAGAGGAAHLPGMLAANTTLPVIGIPVQTHALNGMDSLLSIVQMPTGVPVATVAIGHAGAANAALLAAEMLGIQTPAIAQNLAAYRKKQHDAAVESGVQLVE